MNSNQRCEGFEVASSCKGFSYFRDVSVPQCRENIPFESPVFNVKMRSIYFDSRITIDNLI